MIQQIDFDEIADEAVSDLIDQSTGASLFTPNPGPQIAALKSDADELFFGGAAGGGKSWLLLGASITQHQRSIIYRREFKQLRQLIDDSRELLVNTAARYNGTDYVWRDIPGKRMLEFGATEYAKDVRKYQGRAHDLKAFDEITLFTESMYLFLAGWLRTPILGQRTRIICTGNPPQDAAGEWVIARWGPWLNPEHHNPAEPGELRWFARIDGVDTEVDGSEPFEIEVKRGTETIVETVYPRSRTFIPARIDDNPVYLATGYKAVLQTLDEPVRSQMLYGDFTIGLDDDAWQVIPTEWVLQAMRRGRERARPDGDYRAIGVDVAYGGSDNTVLARLIENYIDDLIIKTGKETPDGKATADLVQQHYAFGTQVYFDAIGYGASAYDTFKVRKGCRKDSHAVNVATGVPFRDKTGMFGFTNLRAYIWWTARQLFDPASGYDICLPDDRNLRVELATPRYKIVNGNYQIEPKEKIKERLGRSPDRAEAVLLALYDMMPKANEAWAEVW